MFPHTVTLYNTRAEPLPGGPGRERTLCAVTLLRGVLLAPAAGVRAGPSGLYGDGSVTLYIPRDVLAIDPADRDAAAPPRKAYCPPRAFWRLEPERRAQCWTLSAGQSSWFARGVALAPPGTPAQQLHDAVAGERTVWYAVRIADADAGALAHFEVEGR